MKYLSSKQNEMITIELYNISSHEYQAKALSDNGDIMGDISFVVNPKKKEIWLRKICTLPQYQNIGVGKALIDTLEYFAHLNNIRSIEGKFYPENEYAKYFYEKNNYEIYKEGYETFVGKYLLKNSDFEKLEARFLDYEELESQNSEKEL